MFHLRRAALRLVSSPSTSLLLAPKPRSFALLHTSTIRSSGQYTFLGSQRRFASDDATAKPEEEISTTQTERTEYEHASAADQSMSEEQFPQEVADATGGIVGNVSRRQRPGSFQRPGLQPPPTNVLYVGNLFFDVTTEDIAREFSRYGDVLHSKVIHDARGLSKGFGYVTFGTVEQATAARESLNQQLFEGRRMSVQFRKPDARAEASPANARGTGAPSRTLFIGNMSFEMTDQDLNELFRDVRNVIDVRVAIDRRTGQPRGFAHADFIDVASAERAKELLDTKEAYGRKLRVDFSYSSRDGQEREQRQRKEQSSEQQQEDQSY